MPPEARKKLLLDLIKVAHTQHVKLFNLTKDDDPCVTKLLDTIIGARSSSESIRKFLTVFDFLETCKNYGFLQGHPLGTWDDPNIVELLKFLQSSGPQERWLFYKIYNDLENDQLKVIYLLFLENHVRLADILKLTWGDFRFDRRALGQYNISEVCMQSLLRLAPDGFPLFNCRPNECLFSPLTYHEIHKMFSSSVEKTLGKRIAPRELQRNWRVLSGRYTRSPLFEEDTSIFDFIPYRIYCTFRDPMTLQQKIVPASLEFQLEWLEPLLRQVRYVAELGFEYYESGLRDVLQRSFYTLPREMQNASMRRVIVGWCLREGIPMPMGYRRRWQGIKEIL